MKKVIFLYFVLSLFCFSNSQTVTGRVVNQTNNGLSDLQVQLFTGGEIYTTTTESSGAFTFHNVTSIEEGELPTGYSISNNYPNPFNPKTRIDISLPKTGYVKVGIFNITGQRVNEVIERVFDAGISYIDLELTGLPNGVYFVNFNIDNQYSVTKKIMLIYGTQHLSSSANLTVKHLGKSTFSTLLDSIIVTGEYISPHTFRDLPPLTGTSVDVGDLSVTVEMGNPCPGTPTVTYAGKTYNTVLIGSQCWLKENLNVGTRINGSQNQTNNSTIEKYCYSDLESNCDTYGGLYQWNEAMQYSTTPGTRGICPPGWHIPTRAEFETLRSAANNNGNALKAIGQGTGSGAGTNTSGFSALLAGHRSNNGNFYNLGLNTYFWSSTEYNVGHANNLYLSYNDSNILLQNGHKDYGFSVRCVQD